MNDYPNFTSNSDDNEPIINQFVQDVQQTAMINDQVNEMNSLCWDKCVDKIGSKLDKRMENCLHNCLNRFYDVSNVIVKRFLNKLEENK